MVDLEPARLPAWRGDYTSPSRVKSSLPFVESARGEYTHRVRSATVYTVINATAFTPKGTMHAAVNCWCGMTLLLSAKKRSRLVAEPSEGRPICATCEGRAIGAGQLGTQEIAGRAVKYSPKRGSA